MPVAALPVSSRWAVTPVKRRRRGELTPPALAFLFEALARNPRRVGKPLVGEFDGLWSARRAEYRVIYEIDDETRTVLIHRVAHRRDVYRRR